MLARQRISVHVPSPIAQNRDSDRPWKKERKGTGIGSGFGGVDSNSYSRTHGQSSNLLVKSDDDGDDDDLGRLDAEPTSGDQCGEHRPGATRRGAAAAIIHRRENVNIWDMYNTIVGLGLV